METKNFRVQERRGILSSFEKKLVTNQSEESEKTKAFVEKMLVINMVMVMILLPGFVLLCCQMMEFVLWFMLVCLVPSFILALMIKKMNSSQIELFEINSFMGGGMVLLFGMKDLDTFILCLWAGCFIFFEFLAVVYLIIVTNWKDIQISDC